MENYISKILVAAPELEDPDFEKSVILIFLQSAEEITGLILNKPFGITLASSYAGLKGLTYPKDWRSFPLFDGGPVATNNLFALHSTDIMTSGSQLVRGDLAWANCDAAILKEIVAAHGPKDVFLASGLANWDPEGFKKELDLKIWRTLPYDPMIVIDANPETMWDRCNAKVEKPLDPSRPFSARMGLPLDESLWPKGTN